MSITGLHVFDKAVDKANEWLHELMDEMDWNDRHRAYVALRAVLHALRDRLGQNDAVRLGADLPMVIRGFYYEGWKPSKSPAKETFFDSVRRHLPDLSDLDPEPVARGVFRVLATKAGQGEMADLRGSIPEDLAGLWP